MPHQFLAGIVAIAAVSNAAPDITPLTPLGNVGPSALPSGYAQYYYQTSTGAIVQDSVSGPFSSSGATTASDAPIVPPGEAMLGTPIAVCFGLTDTDSDGTFTDVHIFFYSPDNVISEYYWTAATRSWHGGSACTACITQSGFVGVNGSQVLYAYENSPEGTIRVGFISAGSPRTLSEAMSTSTTNGGWSVAALPNA